MPVLTKIDAFRASCLLANAEQNSTASSAASSSVSCGIKCGDAPNTPAFSHATLRRSPSSVGRAVRVRQQTEHFDRDVRSRRVFQQKTVDQRLDQSRVANRGFHDSNHRRAVPHGVRSA